MLHSLYTDETPADVKNANVWFGIILNHEDEDGLICLLFQGLHLLTHNTPNGQKVQILLEELHDVYGTEWTTTVIDIAGREQKKDWFLRLNPNGVWPSRMYQWKKLPAHRELTVPGRIPVLVDNTRNPPFPIFESSSELLYLLDITDKDYVFRFADELERSESLQWLFFWHGGGAPFLGQIRHFTSVAPTKIPCKCSGLGPRSLPLPDHCGRDANLLDAIERFKNETLRIYGVLEIHLSGKYTGKTRDYLAGNGRGKYSVADIGTWSWVKDWNRSFTEEEVRSFPHLIQWIARIARRPAVQRGIGEKYRQ